MQNLSLDQLAHVFGGQASGAPFTGRPGDAPSPMMTKPPHQGSDTIRQIGPSTGGTGEPRGGGIKENPGNPPGDPGRKTDALGGPLMPT
ncbi:MAG TPA: hypothetical protein VIV11_30665 [Kofleriaceae bacterium]